ncbi:MAG TPA: hypothetical protein VMH39_13715 [Gemmatimonadaceae bacterium]|nr:hypothetical protein [Gemmatimonadaceae bacterium]
MNDRELAALIKKTTAKASRPKNKNRPTYDAALDATRHKDDDVEKDVERKEFFSEMKRREF